jgi:beta-galactosidase/beta-glucuronidase
LLDPTEALWYHRTIDVKRNPGRRLLLNFEAVDYRSRVWVNGEKVGEHVGGSDPFSIDITDAIKDGVNQLVVRVEDATGGAQLRGKQRLDPQGIWYTRVSGIWQTVWLEEVSARRIERLKITTDPDAGKIIIEPVLAGQKVQGEQMRAVVVEGAKTLAEATAESGRLTLTVKDAKLWSPEHPHLYDLKLTLRDADGKNIDQVASYAGLRKVGSRRDKDGHLRFTLNGTEIFHFGPLDQGWWPDGLLTPPSDEAMRFDIEFLKAAGFNMIRKHIKVEPRRYYYHCDRMGMLVWQDQVSGGPQPAWTRLQPNPKDANWTDADHAQFLREFAAMIDVLGHFPSIVVWTPFNEAWGQHRTLDVGKWTMEYDPTRQVNVASGGNFWPVGHIVDAHAYPHPAFPFDRERYDREYIKVMGEFGGHGWPVQGHLWNNSKRNWGYGGLPQTIDEYKTRYRESIRLLVELKAKGIAAGVYTQTTDVEDEINGLLTYDRKIIKIPAAELKPIHEPLLSRDAQVSRLP